MTLCILYTILEILEVAKQKVVMVGQKLCHGILLCWGKKKQKL